MSTLGLLMTYVPVDLADCAAAAIRPGEVQRGAGRLRHGTDASALVDVDAVIC